MHSLVYPNDLIFSCKCHINCVLTWVWFSWISLIYSLMFKCGGDRNVEWMDGSEKEMWNGLDDLVKGDLRPSKCIGRVLKGV